MSLGVVLRDVSAREAAALCRRAEDVGFDTVFFPETGHLPATPVTGRDPFALAQAALATTSTLKAGPGVAVSAFRPARQMANAAATIDEASGGRFLMGCGVSHADLLRSTGAAYPASPIEHITAYCNELRAAAEWTPTGRAATVLLGALGDKMLGVARSHADGVVLNWVSPTLAGTIAQTGRDEAGDAWAAYAFVRVGPRAALLNDADTYKTNLANYRKHFERQQWATSDDVVESACIVAGEPSRLFDRLDEYRAAGLRTPCLYPVGMSGEEIEQLFTSVAAREAAA